MRLHQSAVPLVAVFLAVSRAIRQHVLDPEGTRIPQRQRVASLLGEVMDCKDNGSDDGAPEHYHHQKLLEAASPSQTNSVEPLHGCIASKLLTVARRYDRGMFG